MTTHTRNTRTVTAADVNIGDTIKASTDTADGHNDFRTVERICQSQDGRKVTFVFAGPDGMGPGATLFYGKRSFRIVGKVEVVAC